MLPRFTGEILQAPPAYSAIKVAGERAYDLAREGEAPALEPRAVLIGKAELLSQPDADQPSSKSRQAKALMSGPGCAIWRRPWARLASVSLRRLKLGPLSVRDAISLEKLEAFRHSPAAFEHLDAPFDRAGRHPGTGCNGPQMRFASAAATPFSSALPHFARMADEHDFGEAADGGSIQGLTVYLSTAEGEPVALAQVAEGELRPFRVFNFGTGTEEFTMSVTTERKKEVIDEYAKKAGDTGSPEVQVAVLSESIANLTEHFKPTSRTIIRAAASSRWCRSGAGCSII